MSSTKPTPLPQTYHYIRLAITPPLGSDNTDGLAIRRLLQEALAQSFGLALSHVYLDVLGVTATGDECVLRANSSRYSFFFFFFPIILFCVCVNFYLGRALSWNFFFSLMG
jgi:hypothetical protein